MYGTVLILLFEINVYYIVLMQKINKSEGQSSQSRIELPYEICKNKRGKFKLKLYQFKCQQLLLSCAYRNKSSTIDIFTLLINLDRK